VEPKSECESKRNSFFSNGFHFGFKSGANAQEVQAAQQTTTKQETVHDTNTSPNKSSRGSGKSVADIFSDHFPIFSESTSEITEPTDEKSVVNDTSASPDKTSRGSGNLVSGLFSKSTTDTKKPSDKKPESDVNSTTSGEITVDDNASVLSSEDLNFDDVNFDDDNVDDVNFGDYPVDHQVDYPEDPFVSCVFGSDTNNKKDTNKKSFGCI